MRLETKFCSSLAKVMPVTGPETGIRQGCALRGERFSFQLAYRKSDARNMLDIKVKSPFGKHLRMRKVELVPVDYTATRFDDDVISRDPGLYPDVLRDFDPKENWAPLLPTWRSVWFTVDIPEDWKPGIYEITVSLRDFWAFNADPVYTDHGSKIFTLEVLDAVMPPQTLKNTHWFHTDCLASWYKVPVFSEEYWRIVGNFMKSAARHGINMLLTPIVTPPLDTQVGGERPTVQLVKIQCNHGKYTFDFSLLDRWIKLALKSGIQYFEMAHLFTQWGAGFTPKIMAEVDGKEKRIFGWDVSSRSDEYRKFLDAFLPQLVKFLKQKKIADRCCFHCSDEPSPVHLENYQYAKALLKKHLHGFKIMDALSHVDFFKQGIVTTPVPIESKLDEFIPEKPSEIWTYYCCGPDTVYSNRFIYMPSSRNRIFGALLYTYKVEGFLHWGFNFYFSGYSRHLIDPYHCNNSGLFFPAGDAFLLYPGEDGVPEDSIRYEVFYEALQDQRILEKLESLIGRDAVMKVLNSASPKRKMTMAQYPRGEKRVLALRQKINRLIKEAISK